MKNKLLYNLIFIIFAVSVCFSFLSLSASAQSLTDELVEFSCAEPPADSNNGYFIIFYKTTSDKIMARLLSWNVTNVKLSQSADSGVNGIPSAQIRIETNHISLRFQGQGLAYYSLFDVTSDTNNLNETQYGMIDYTNTELYRFQFAPNELLGYAIYGNGVIYSNSHPYVDELYPVLFNESKTQYNQMLQLLNICQTLGIKLDAIETELYSIEGQIYALYELVASDVMYYLDNISQYSYQTQAYLLECKQLLEEIRDSLNASGPSFDEVMGEDKFGNALGDYNTNDAINSLPNQFEGDKVGIYSGIGFFTKIYDNLLYYMPELKHAITFILTLSFAGYVLGRKLNKEG